MAENMHSEAFWIETYSFMFARDRMEAAVEQVEQMLALTGAEGPHVLDLCCGPGRHALDLARRGFVVTGVDSSEFLLGKARERAAAEGCTVEWVLDDMRTFARPESYDLAINFFTSFGYFPTRAEDFKVLRNACLNLKPGGVFILELKGRECLANVFTTTSSEKLEDGTVLVDRREIYDDWTRVRGEWFLIREGTCRTFEVDLALYSGQELRALLMKAGFAGVELYGDLAGNPYDHSAERLVAVARKAT